MGDRAWTRGRGEPGGFSWAASAVSLLAVVSLAACSGAADEAPSAQPEAPAATADAPAAAGSPTSDPVGKLTASLPPAATTPVPAPGDGDISTEVDAGEQELLAPVSFEETVDVDSRMTAQVVEVVHTRGRARTAGEIAGPAIKVTVRLTNISQRSVSLGGVTVAAHDADNAVLSPLGSKPSRPFRGRVAAGRVAEAVYVFSLPKGGSTPFTIAVNYAAGAPVAVFVGDHA